MRNDSYKTLRLQIHEFQRRYAYLKQYLLSKVLNRLVIVESKDVFENVRMFNTFTKSSSKRQQTAKDVQQDFSVPQITSLIAIKNCLVCSANAMDNVRR